VAAMMNSSGTISKLSWGVRIGMLARGRDSDQRKKEKMS
jgi:hypothetical protein